MENVIRIQLDDKTILLPYDLLASAIRSALPAWLLGTTPCQSPQQQVLKSTLKGIMPTVVSMMTANLPNPALRPNLKSPAAKANVIAYMVDYLVNTLFAVLSEYTLEAQYTSHDDCYEIDGFLAAVTTVEMDTAAPTSALAGSPSSAN